MAVVNAGRPAPATPGSATSSAAGVRTPSAAASAAALVNGVAVESVEVQQLVKGLARAEPSPPDSKRIETLTTSALESLIDLELLNQEAARRGVTVTGAEVDREVAAVRQHFASEPEFVAALESRDMTAAGLRRDTQRTLMANRLLQMTAWKGLSVGDDEVARFYAENRDQLAKPLEDLHDSIGRMLLDDKKAARRAELVESLRKEATILRLPPYGSDSLATPTAATSGTRGAATRPAGR